MHFVDETTIFVRAGKGGDGAVSFHRARRLPFGGPDGGDGGNGGSIIIRASRDVDTLLPLARTQRYVARNGEPGSGRCRHGKSAPDLIIFVPVGTIIHKNGEVIADLQKEGEECLVARGGKGGRGNRSFATAENQVPREFTYGEEGEAATLHLEIKLIADIGLIGMPNAGKSTLLARLTAARPKIADYPFTTLQPQLGIVSDGHDRQLVLADIPGLIEGAAAGAGLGMEFLRHVERCRVLIHLVDLVPLDSDPLKNWAAINKELRLFSATLAAKPQLTVGNKLDLTGADKALARLRAHVPGPVLGISAISGAGLGELKQTMFALLRQYPRDAAR
ncbi:MAG: GTPase ObgE [Planctomycetota bacterium]|nr:GTPase ObgE [Planctomycetota bacterium]